MYSRTFDETNPIIPENYSGTAMDRTPPEEEKSESSPEATESREAEESVQVSLKEQPHKNPLLDQDLLLLLLAFLLMGKDNTEELPALLLLLLAFQS